MAGSNRIEELINELQKGVYEKNEVFVLSVLAMLSGESIFLLGKPGIAKSLVARRIKYAFKDGSIFEYLMNRFSTPEEIFGPISIEGIQKGEYKRLTKKYLPSADIVFLDEIWKAGPSIQNTLLTIINEKIFRNAGEDVKVPMKLLMSASNELPAPGQGLEALFDRFIIRYIVEGLKDENNFNEMIAGDAPLEISVDSKLQIKAEEFFAWQKEIKKVQMDELTFNFISDFRKGLDVATEGEAYISDRRWKKIAGLMKTSAYFNGRVKVDKQDWLIIPYCIWDDEQQEEEYSALFNEFYFESLKVDIFKKWEALKVELAELKKQYAFVLDNTTEKSIYQNVFSKKLPGSFHRLLWKNSENPINFMKAEDYTKIFHSNGKATEIEIFCGDELDNLISIKKVSVVYINEKTLQINGDTVGLEIQNKKDQSELDALQTKINEVAWKVDNLPNLMVEEKERLEKTSTIFFRQQFDLVLNNAFAEYIEIVNQQKIAEHDNLEKRVQVINETPVEETAELVSNKPGSNIE
ncbi:MoxR-like ATPase [Spiroplasma sp. TIUS-1]|uniref:AAA family ATPase n=1 Tax=Spiroplasma sp. TIUS-1 TaxID=216963 RepID=UPI0013982E00|nr:AAA family ATPase [Spiroplasma sp. TIUS-1]QHX35814.1 MoxR-like ATPase [Spiroplasma sp. TIUS-1]